jgi:hypothetical protein
MIEMEIFEPEHFPPVKADLQPALLAELEAALAGRFDPDSTRGLMPLFGLTGMLGGKPVGIVFFALRQDGALEVSLVTTNAVRKNPVAFARAYGRVVGSIANELHAVLNDDFPGHHRFIRKFGFECVGAAKDILGNPAKEYVRWALQH